MQLIHQCIFGNRTQMSSTIANHRNSETNFQTKHCLLEPVFRAIWPGIGIQLAFHISPPLNTLLLIHQNHFRSSFSSCKNSLFRSIRFTSLRAKRSGNERERERAHGVRLEARKIPIPYVFNETPCRNLSRLVIKGIRGKETRQTRNFERKREPNSFYPCD